MSTLTIPLDDEIYSKVQVLSWVRWSKVVQDGIRKRRILETYLREKSISENDAAFCEAIDWHPVDELPIKQEVIDKLKKTGSYKDRLRGLHKKVWKNTDTEEYLKTERNSWNCDAAD